MFRPMVTNGRGGERRSLSVEFFDHALEAWLLVPLFCKFLLVSRKK